MKNLFMIVLLVSCITSQAQWTQIGQDIDGESAEDRSGTSISLSDDGNIVAIGAPFNNGNGTYSGHVRVYQNTGVWTQIGADIDSESAEDRSGTSVSLSNDGNIVAIGAIHNDGNGSNSGHVRVYQNTGGAWTQIGADIGGESTNDRSGTSVSLSANGSIVAIGATYNIGAGSGSGHIRIYQNTGGAWTQIGADIDGEAASDKFGTSVSLSADGSIVAIGAHFNDDNGSQSGHVRIYQNIGGTWTQIGADLDGEATYDYSGSSVSLSDNGSIVAIGAGGNDGNGWESGHVRVYQNSGGTWIQIGADINGEAADDWSGENAVSLNSDGSIVAIGAIYNAVNGIYLGHVRIYHNIGGTWTQTWEDIDGEAGYDEFGTSVSLSANGNIVAIGAIKNDDNGINAGHVRVYTSGQGTTYSTQTISSCDPYLSPSGNYLWTSSGTYVDTIANSHGGDSIMTIELTIEIIDIAVTQAGETLTANTVGAQYQWIDCNNNFIELSGEIYQNFTPLLSGNYAVILTENGCSDTSSCYTVTVTGIKTVSKKEIINIHPNPTKGIINIEILNHDNNYRYVSISNLLGNKFIEESIFGNKTSIDISYLVKGIYLIKIEGIKDTYVKRIIKY